MTFNNKRLAGIVISAATLLVIPVIAMQFTKEVNWSGFDFLVAGILLFGTGLLSEFVLRTVKKRNYRIILCGIIFLALVVIWIELAIGIFGTPLAGS